MVKIKLKKIGRKKLPIYKIIVAEAMSKRDGKPVDILGTYNPKSKELEIDVEKANTWIEKGAEPTPRVASLIKIASKSN